MLPCLAACMRAVRPCLLPSLMFRWGNLGLRSSVGGEEGEGGVNIVFFWNEEKN